MNDNTHEEMQNLFSRLRIIEEQLDNQSASLVQIAIDEDVSGMTREAGIPRELWGISHLIGEVADDLWELSEQYEKQMVVYRMKSEILDEVAGVMYHRMEEHTAIHGDSTLDTTRWEEGSIGTGKSSPRKETGKVIQFDCTMKNNEEEK